MRFAAVIGSMAIACATAQAQKDDMRSNDINRLARLHSIDLTHGDWQHEPVDVCPAFTRHTFVYYHRDPQPGVRTAFILVLPNQGGHAMLVPVAGGVTGDGSDVAGRTSTMKTFNSVWHDELSVHGTKFPGFSWADLGTCYVRLAGEQPLIVRDPGTLDPPPSISLTEQPVTGLLIPVNPPVKHTRSVSIGIDAHGMFNKVGIVQVPAFD